MSIKDFPPIITIHYHVVTMVTTAFNSFTNPFKTDNEKRMIHHKVYMLIKLVFER